MSMGVHHPYHLDLCADDEDPYQLIIRPGWDAPHVRCFPRTLCAWPCLRQVGTVLGSPCDCIVTGITYANPGSRQVFKCAMEGDERRSWSVKRSSLGMPPCNPNKYSRRLKHLSLGMPPCIPFSINNYQFILRSTIFLSLHALCAMLGVSCSLLFSFI